MVVMFSPGDKNQLACGTARAVKGQFGSRLCEEGLFGSTGRGDARLPRGQCRGPAK